MSNRERAETIARLRRKGYSWPRVGAVVGLSARGAANALRTARNPGWWKVACEEEVDPFEAPPEEQW